MKSKKNINNTAKEYLEGDKSFDLNIKEKAAFQMLQQRIIIKRQIRDVH